MTKTTKQTKQTAKAAATTAKAAATIIKMVVAETAAEAALTAADVYRELAEDLDNATLRTAVASMVGPEFVGLDTNASWYRWDAKRQAARAARAAKAAARKQS